jgi:hypothetical protein
MTLADISVPLGMGEDIDSSIDLPRDGQVRLVRLQMDYFRLFIREQTDKLPFAR